MRKIDPDLIRREATAAKLNISLRQLDRLAAAGQIPEPFRFGPGCVLYSEREIDAFIESQRKAG
jgi:predicted DNA-binding transcriptional regulator AlpA